ncbi:hypothetical protein [Sphingomonas sp. CARO-RG-8B-R24-01]|uniref:hypothetical protein n=1 Tax=Sphingomonas sp. CARO-RG-8B-R24-01 TaxID=2914831 RepID=UPI001F58C3FF|nr:hypothetical protein [Sphingomonas sp. CARO-RG-8B-R24-01]
MNVMRRDRTETSAVHDAISLTCTWIEAARARPLGLWTRGDRRAAARLSIRSRPA